jgi:hypothetical protein
MDEAGRRNSSRLSFAVTAAAVGRGYKARTTERTFMRRCFAASATARTKPFDLAYERFSQWVLSESDTLCDKGEIDFKEIFGSDYAPSVMALLCYFAKSLGCRIVYVGYKPSVELRRILTTRGITNIVPLRITFGINDFCRRVDPSARTIGKGDLITWSPGCDQFHWSETIGYLEVYHWLNVVYDPFPFGGDPVSRPIRAARLGRHDPLPGEPATTAAGTG